MGLSCALLIFLLYLTFSVVLIKYNQKVICLKWLFKHVNNFPPFGSFGSSISRIHIFRILNKWQHLICNYIDASFLILTVTILFVALAVRDKLESLCRELQRQNKMLMVYFFPSATSETDSIMSISICGMPQMFSYLYSWNLLLIMQNLLWSQILWLKLIPFQ